MSWHVGAAALTLWADGFISDAELAEIKGMVKEGLEYGSPATVRLREMLAEKGYDGIAYPNGFEGEGLSYIALYDSQIIRVPASESASTDHQGGVTQHFSREADADYLSAVENGDMDKAQRMVDEAAQVAGYDTPRLYHGTNGFGFTEFDLERGEQLIFATSDRNVAQTYSGETERRRISERATINVDSLQGETLLQAAQEKLSKYEGYELLTEAEKQNAARENRRSISGILQKAADFVNDNEGAFDSEKMAVMDDMLNALSDISEAQTDDALDEAWNRWTDKLWDLKWMDESVTEELLKAIDSRELMFQKNQLHDFLYGGDIFCQRGTYGFSYVFDNQVALELDAALHMGVYEMYGRGGNQLVIDADGSNWNQIRPPEELNLYGPQKTRDIAAAAKANGYDSVLIRDLRDSGGGMNYNYPSDIYIFFDANQVKSADPVTYDDDGNVIPISKRFNPEERDIRWSLDLNDRDERSVQRENERLERTLRETFPLPRNAGSGTREMLDSITTQIIENGGVTDEALDEAFRYLMENSRFTIDPAPELRDAAERYKGMRIYVPEGVKAELGDDWNSLRRQALGQGVYFVTQEGVNTTSIEDMDLDAIPGYTTAGGADYRAALQGIVDTVRGSRARQMTGNDYLREVGQTQGRETEDAVREELRRQSDAAITDHADGVLEVLQPRTRSEELDRLTALEPEENRAEERRENRPVETRDLDDYFRLLAQTAGALAQIDYDGRDLITSEDGEKRKGLKRTVSEAWHYFQRKMVDAGEAVTRIGRAVRDPHLYHYYNMARASANAAISMIENSATDIRGRKTGKGLNEIFSAIRKQGDAYYDDFQMYMYHLHNIDRMSRYSQGEVDRARGEFEAFQAMNPELLGYADYQIERMAQDDTSELYFEAQEYIRLRDAMRKAENTVDKPVFGYEVGADESRAIVRKLGTAHPEFEQYAQDVYDYIDNLMQYRVDSGLITDEDYDRLTEIYPHYVPTFRIFEDDGTGRTAKNSVRIGKTIGRAEGSSERLMPLHKALAQQTLSVVREGSKNRFGQRLLDSGADRIQGAKEHVRSIDEYKGSFSEDTFDKGEETDELFRKTNTFIVRQGGKMYEMTISPALYEAVKALSPDSTEANAFTRVVRAGNDLFKRLVTGDNPVFLVRNFMRDLQDVGLYSKDLSAFAAQYPQAVAEIAKNGAYWQMYKALGGTYSSFFDYETGNVDRGSWLKRNTMNRVEALNEAIEQAPRLAEFMATVKKKGGLDADMDTLMEAMYNAAEVTVNFGRSGTLGKVLNANYVPFLNPGIQGFSKMIRTITETRGAKNWARLAVKAAALGIAPALLNALLYRDDDEWDELKDRDKDIYYLFKLKDGLWLKLPKGRTLSVLGGLATRGVQLAKGEDVDWGGFFSTAVSQTAPANPLSENILKAWFDADLFNRESTGRTWYGTSIESQRLQNLAPGERYDASTDVLSKWLGKTFNLSPKKINYLLDQYTGVIGDIALPWMATAARKGMFQSAFTLDSTVSNELSGEFYDKADELNYQKNGGDATGVDKIVYRFWSKQSSGVSDINAMIREIEADASLSNKEKQELLHEQYRLRNGAERNALDILDEYTAAAQRWYDAASDIEDEDDRIDYAYRETNREIFGAEYALKTYNKSVYETAQAMNAGGDISYEQFYDLYFRMKQADNELTGYEKSNAKRDAIRESDLDDVQKALMYRKYISDSRDDDIIAFTNAGMSMDDFLRAQNEYSTVGNEYHKATEKATAFSRWLDDQDLTPEQKQVVKESFTFYSQISQDSKRYDELVAAGLSEDTAYELAASLSGLTAEEGAKSVTDQQKYQAIIDAGLSAKETDKAFSAIMTESKYAKWQDCSAAGITAKEFVAVNGQYTAINKEDLKASQKATEFAHWLDGQSFSEDEKAVLEDSFGFYSQIRQDAKYDEFTAAGLDKDTAYAVTQGILALEPEEGADSVSSLQKWQVVADSDMSESQKMQAMSVLMTDAEYAKLETGSSYGVTVDAYYLFKKTLPTYDADGNGSFKQEEVEAALDSLCGNGGLVLPSVDTAVTTLTVAQCAALWQMANKSWKPKNNPFSKTVGAQVYEALNAGADSGDEVEIVIPTLTEDGGIVLPSVG